MSIRKLMGTLAGSVTALAVISTAATPAAAQGGVELTPWVGAYIPTSNSVGGLDEDISRNTGAAGGVRLTFWGTGNLGFEATGGYAPAKIGNETINQSGNTDLLLANARLLLALSPVTNSVGFYLAAGPALLSRGSDPFDNDASSTDFGGVLGLGEPPRPAGGRAGGWAWGVGGLGLWGDEIRTGWVFEHGENLKQLYRNF